MQLRVATYNIHQFCGHSWRMNIERTLAALRALDADVLALQEVVSGCAFPERLLVVGPRSYTWLADQLGMHAVGVPAIDGDAGKHGNVILSRTRIRSFGSWDLAVSRREPRNALYAVIDTAWGALRVVTTHLGLSPAERREQTARLVSHVNQDADCPTVLAGDFNEWGLRGPVGRMLRRHFRGHLPIPSFPAVAPMLALDRIWWRPRPLVRRVTRPGHTLFRLASDHSPLVAELSAPAA